MSDTDRSGWTGGAPGGSGPGDPGHRGEATLADEGAAAGPESFVEPTRGEEAAEPPVTATVREMWDRADAQTAERDRPAGPTGRRHRPRGG